MYQGDSAIFSLAIESDDSHSMIIVYVQDSVLMSWDIPALLNGTIHHVMSWVSIYIPTFQVVVWFHHARFCV